MNRITGTLKVVGLRDEMRTVSADTWYRCLCDVPGCQLMVRWRQCEVGHDNAWSDRSFGDAEFCHRPGCTARYLPGFVESPYPEGWPVKRVEGWDATE